MREHPISISLITFEIRPYFCLALPLTHALSFAFPLLFAHSANVCAWFVAEAVRYSFFRQVITCTLPISGCNSVAVATASAAMLWMATVIIASVSSTSKSNLRVYEFSVCVCVCVYVYHIQYMWVCVCVA